MDQSLIRRPRPERSTGIVELTGGLAEEFGLVVLSSRILSVGVCRLFGMEFGEFTDDQLDEIIVGAEAGVARLRGLETAAIAEKRARKSHLQDGYRSIVDWVAAKADVSHKTARSLCWTATRLREAPDVAKALESGEVTFDRAEQVSRLPEGHRRGHERFDIAQLRRKVAHHKRISSRRERRSAIGYLNFQPSGDEMTDSIWGELPGTDAVLVKKAVDQRADEILDSSAGLGVAERRAMALVSICQDSLYDETTTGQSSSGGVTVIVDAKEATTTGGESGVSVLGGPRMGRQALKAIVCDSQVEVLGLAADGQPLNLGRKTRTVSPALRRFVLARDMGCTVEGCSSDYRLEVHHTIPFSEGGATDADDLVSVCWYHHHVAIHRLGFQIFRIAVSRVRLFRPS